MITADTISSIIEALGQQATDDIEWAESLKLPSDADNFALETIFVICNSGMKNTVARRIYDKVQDALETGGSAGTVFGHRGKCAAIDRIWKDREEMHAGFLASNDRLTWLEDLPWIGPITKYHLAKNFGVDCAKPDVHLQRLADQHGCTAQALCERLAAETGYRVATIDTLLWRACANGVINSRTGELK